MSEAQEHRQHENGYDRSCRYHESAERRYQEALKQSIDALAAVLASLQESLLHKATDRNLVPMKTHLIIVLSALAASNGKDVVSALWGLIHR
jgi:hypothetical protein